MDATDRPVDAGIDTPTDVATDAGGPQSVDPVFEITDPDEPCDCGCGMAEDAR